MRDIHERTDCMYLCMYDWIADDMSRDEYACVKYALPHIYPPNHEIHT